MKKRLGALLFVMTLALALVAATVAVAGNAADQLDEADEETRQEHARGRAAETGAPVAGARSSSLVVTAPLTAPLFAGIDDVSVFAQAIDPATNVFFPLFNGIEIWGAAYDPDSETVYIADNTTLHAWPIGESPSVVGTIKSSSTASNLSISGLAFVHGTLYGSYVIGGPNPEGIYAIDTSTAQATLAFSYSVASTATELGGIDGHPQTGVLYGTNDAGPLQGLVRLGTDGSVTVVAPYPDGQTDIDGLAIGTDNRAYLITDQPGSFYVFDFDTLTYTLPITNPWETAKLFSGGAWVYEPLIPSIALSKTVGLDPNECATTDEIDVAPGTDVTYCYQVTNTGEMTLNSHDLEDDQLGTVLSDFSYSLDVDASVFVTQTASITQSIANTATWTAYNSGPTNVVSATDTAMVTVVAPAITLSKTVGLDPDGCATSTALSVAPGTEVTYCFEVTNTGLTTFGLHDLSDSQLGQILSGTNVVLSPSASVFVTATAAITTTTVNTATWTAYNEGPSDMTSAVAMATVEVVPPSIALSKTVGLDPDTCATTTALSVSPGTEVTYCFEVTNTGLTPFALHDLSDSHLGQVLSGTSVALSPGASQFVTATAEITATTVNTATWTAYTTTPEDGVMATAVATVTLGLPSSPEIEVSPLQLTESIMEDEVITTTLTISNTGDLPLTWTVTEATPTCATPAGLVWVESDPPAGTTAPGGVSAVVVTFGAPGLPVADYAGSLCVSSNDADEPVTEVGLSLAITEPPRYLLYLPAGLGSPDDDPDTP